MGACSPPTVAGAAGASVQHRHSSDTNLTPFPFASPKGTVDDQRLNAAFALRQLRKLQVSAFGERAVESALDGPQHILRQSLHAGDDVGLDHHTRQDGMGGAVVVEMVLLKRDD